MVGGGSEKSVRRRQFTVKSLSSVELSPGVLEALSMSTLSSYVSGGGANDQTYKD